MSSNSDVNVVQPLNAQVYKIDVFARARLFVYIEAGSRISTALYI